STSRTTAVEMLGMILDSADRFETIKSIDDIQVNPVFESELEKLFIGALAKPDATGPTVRIQQQVVNGKPGYFLTVGKRYYTIEPQVLVSEKDGVVFPSKPDFLIRSADARDGKTFLPIAVFLDGFKYHKKSVGEDSAKRLSLAQSRRYRVWSLTWDDVQGQYAGKIIKSRNPFAEALNTEMLPVQNGMLQRMDITGLFKVALLPSITQLLNFLAEPDVEARQGLAFVRMLGWFSQASMRDELMTSAMRKRIQKRGVASMIERLDTLKEVACGRLGGGTDLLDIDCVVDLEAISRIQPDLALCNIWLDDSDSESEALKPAWQGFIKAYNLLQFLPYTGFSSANGVKAGVYETIAFDASKTDPASDEFVEVEDLLQDILETIRPSLATWLRQGGVIPTVGYELQNHDGEVIAEAELAWPEHRVAGLLDEQDEFLSIFQSAGWRAFRLDEAGEWASSDPLTI
ncbi:MAG: hypothetical protein ABFR65_03145, partial [Pseudomonadota bacterium]